MASSYTTNAQLEIITTGEKAGQWGGINNTNLQILEQTALQEYWMWIYLQGVPHLF